MHDIILHRIDIKKTLLEKPDVVDDVLFTTHRITRETTKIIKDIEQSPFGGLPSLQQEVKEAKSTKSSMRDLGGMVLGALHSNRGVPRHDIDHGYDQ